MDLSIRELVLIPGIGGFLVFAIRHPRRLGSMLPLIVAGWYEGRAALDAARQSRRDNAKPPL